MTKIWVVVEFTQHQQQTQHYLQRWILLMFILIQIKSIMNIKIILKDISKNSTMAGDWVWKTKVIFPENLKTKLLQEQSEPKVKSPEKKWCLKKERCNLKQICKQAEMFCLCCFTAPKNRQLSNDGKLELKY